MSMLQMLASYFAKSEVNDKQSQSLAKLRDTLLLLFPFWKQPLNTVLAELKVSLIMLLANNDYPPIDRDEVYKEIFEQAKNFKKNQAA